MSIELKSNTGSLKLVLPTSGGSVDLTGYATEEYVDNAVDGVRTYYIAPISRYTPNVYDANKRIQITCYVDLFELVSNRKYWFVLPEVDNPNGYTVSGTLRITLTCDDGTVKNLLTITYSGQSGFYFYVKQYNDYTYHYYTETNPNTMKIFNFQDKSTSSNVIVEAENNINYLATNGGWEYTPTNDYSPATKKYVDDLIAELNTRLSALETTE